MLADMIVIEQLDHLVLTVSSIVQSSTFYGSVLGMRVETFGAGRTALCFGTCMRLAKSSSPKRHGPLRVPAISASSRPPPSPKSRNTSRRAA